MPWETVLNVNQDLCRAQKTAHQPKLTSSEAARQLWERAVPKAMSLADALTVCRQCQELGAFVFNNGNTFAAISRTLVEDWVQSLPSVEAQILLTTVSHYVAGEIHKKELLTVLRHVEMRWKTAPSSRQVRPAIENAPARHALPDASA